MIVIVGFVVWCLIFLLVFLLYKCFRNSGNSRPNNTNTVRWTQPDNNHLTFQNDSKHVYAYSHKRVVECYVDDGFSWERREVNPVIGTKRLLRRLHDCRSKVLGLDCEWVSDWKNGRRPVALLQLATPDGFCALFRLCKIDGELPSELLSVLQNPSILKVGVEVNRDAQYLLYDHGITCKGCLDLRYMAVKVGSKSRGLGSLSYELFGLEMDKDSWQADWEADEIDESDLDYAANDARMGYRIFDRLNKQALIKDFQSFLSYNNVHLDWEITYAMWSSYLDKPFKENRHS